MTTTESLNRCDTMVARIDRWTCYFASAAVGLGQELIDALVTDVLRQVGQVLELDYVVLDTFADDHAGGGPRRAWVKQGGAIPNEPALSIRVAVSERCMCALSIGLRGDEPPRAVVMDSLRALAHVMSLVILRHQQAREVERIAAELREATPPPSWKVDDSWDDDFQNIIGDSPALRIAINRVQEVAPTDATVVLLGETGTGKELFARAVHDRSVRRGRPFVRVNCAALPSTLIETELFGHVRGAYTGAVAMRQGRFEIADGGTLFLDEIGDLPADVQAKLLRVLQEGEFERVGSSQPRKVDVRIVAATHHDLDEAMRQGRFRADLYYRLNVFPIALPPLRERTEDIPRLVWYFINRRQRALNRKFTTVPISVFAALQQRPWQGNVRELQNVIERAMIHSNGDTLVLDDEPVSQAQQSIKEGGTLADVERQYVEDALRRCRWRINGRGNAAETLGLHPNTLRNRMKKFGIQRPQPPTPIDAGRLSA